MATGPGSRAGRARDSVCGRNVLEPWDFFQRRHGTNAVEALATPSG